MAVLKIVKFDLLKLITFFFQLVKTLLWIPVMVVFLHSRSSVLCVWTEVCGAWCDVFWFTCTWWNSILILLICYRVQWPRTMSIIKKNWNSIIHKFSYPLSLIATTAEPTQSILIFRILLCVTVYGITRADNTTKGTDVNKQVCVTVSYYFILPRHVSTLSSHHQVFYM
jgi:hypothetical protein